jgi:hypothetical protein
LNLTHPIRIATVVLAATALAAATGCDNKRPDDPPSTPLANEYGDGEHISSVLLGFFGPATWVKLSDINSVDCYDPPDITVLTAGVTISAVDQWDETGNGAIGTVYVQDPVSPTPLYAGMALYEPTYSPPAYKPEPGNVVQVAGVYEEYIGPSDLALGRFGQCETLPQLEGTATELFEGQVPEPVVITPADLNSYANARQYLSMLVTVTNVCMEAAGEESDGRYSAPVSVSGTAWSIDDELWDVYHLMPLAQGQCFTSVTGIVTFFEGFSLAPRSAADFKM